MPAPAPIFAPSTDLEARIFDALVDPNLTPPTTSHLLSSTVNWSNVSTINMAYDDSLGNHYVLFFHRP